MVKIISNNVIPTTVTSSRKSKQKPIINESFECKFEKHNANKFAVNKNLYTLA